MTTPKHTNEMDDMEQSELFAKLSGQLTAMPPSPASIDALASRLDRRIKTSIANHINLMTIRAKEGIWRTLISGVRYKTLWQGNEGNSVLIEFAPGAALPVHRHNYLEEGIVLSGSLEHDGEQLTQFDYHVSPPASQHGQISSKDGALAFLRGTSLGDTAAMFKEVAGGLLTKRNNQSQSIKVNKTGWVEIQPGCHLKELWTDGKTASRYYRLDPGTTLPGLYHPITEECLVLNGEVFIGDILMQTGDYQLAPAGTKHLKSFSDVGALLYVRAAL